MKDHNLMKTSEATHHLYEHLPDIVLFEQCIILLVVAYLLKQIPRVSILHHDATEIHENKFYHKDWEASSMKASLYATILGCLIDARIRTSFNAFSFSLSESFCIRTFFRA